MPPLHEAHPNYMPKGCGSFGLCPCRIDKRTLRTPISADRYGRGGSDYKSSWIAEYLPSQFSQESRFFD